MQTELRHDRFKLPVFHLKNYISSPLKLGPVSQEGEKRNLDWIIQINKMYENFMD